MSSSVKCLGVHIDNQLSWKAHISYLTNKINKFIGIICKIRYLLNKQALKMLYYSLIQSNLSYCQEIWSCAYSTNLYPLRVAQKKIIRLIANAPRRAPSKSLFEQLGIRTLDADIKLRRGILAFNAVKNPHLFPIVIETEHAHSYPTRYRENNIPVQRARTETYGNRGLRHLLLSSYNALPSVVKLLQPHQLNYAKKILKTTCLE